MEQMGEGFLKVRVTTAGGTLPVEGAVVTVTEYDRDDTGRGEVLYSQRTDRGGLTQTLSLAAPSSSDSLRPGAAQPYAVYNVTVTYDGYYPVEGVGVPVFDRIVAVQPVNLIPLSEADTIAGAQGDRVMIYETQTGSSLQPGGADREEIGNENGSITGGMRQNGMEGGGR